MPPRPRRHHSRHRGPTAQDFRAAFGLGEDDTTISTVDAQGVALAAVQGLFAVVQEKDGRIAVLESDVAALKQHQGEAEAPCTPALPALPLGWAVALGGLAVGGGTFGGLSFGLRRRGIRLHDPAAVQRATGGPFDRAAYAAAAGSRTSSPAASSTGPRHPLRQARRELPRRLGDCHDYPLAPRLACAYTA